jgi:hypothetical protein
MQPNRVRKGGISWLISRRVGMEGRDFSRFKCFRLILVTRDYILPLAMQVYS